MAQENSPVQNFRQGATLKSFIVGVLLCLFLSVAEPYSVFYRGSTGMCADFICAGAVILLFIFTGFINAGLGKINRKTLPQHIQYSTRVVAGPLQRVVKVVERKDLRRGRTRRGDFLLD